jgi:hypothetical protein
MGFDLLSEIQASGEVVDLLISFACAACGNGKIDFFYPENVSYFKPDGTLLSFLKSDQKAHDHQKLLGVLDRIPAIKSMQKYKTSSELKWHLDQIHELIYPLLVWLITTNRAYLRPLRPKEQFSQLKQVCCLTFCFFLSVLSCSVLFCSVM